MGADNNKSAFSKPVIENTHILFHFPTEIGDISATSSTSAAAAIREPIICHAYALVGTQGLLLGFGPCGLWFPKDIAVRHGKARVEIFGRGSEARGTARHYQRDWRGVYLILAHHDSIKFIVAAITIALSEELRLDATDANSTIVCTLQTVLLDDAIYEAISYVWGDPKHTRQILCNGYLLDVTVSLYGALQRLRRLPEIGHRNLWTDAICIDQSNTVERSSQVSMMASIYERATAVHVWLGEDVQGHAQSAFELIEEINDYHDDGYRSDEESVSYVWPDPPPSDQSFLDPRRWKHLQALSQMPWFNRLCVLQEVGVARTVDVHWGKSGIKFSNLTACFVYIDRCPYFLPLVSEYGGDFYNIIDAWDLIWCTYQSKRSWTNERPYLRFSVNHPDIQQRQQFINVLWAGARFTASVPHDYIYAFLGHPSARGPDGVDFVKVDDSKSLNDLYLDVAEKLLAQAHGDLTLLSIVYHTGNSLSTGPSWVPQWHQSSPCIIAPLPGQHVWYNASLSESTESKIPVMAGLAEGARLYTRGITFDTVSTCSAALERSPNAALNHTVEAAWSLFQPLSSTEVLDALSLVLIWGLGGYTGSAAEDDFQKHKTSFVSYCLAETTLDPAIKSEMIRIQEGLSEEGNGVAYKVRVRECCPERKVFKTASGRFGLGPSAMRPGDICCILFGARVPFVIRRCDQAFKLVGECYIHGVMRGEIVAEEPLQKRGVEEIVFT
ncbi:MAG: hypothetical protein LQ349_007509 [Xanthoria aureola]|nr:MAG: hypothetical protein LQ349_007509 [Xanthoria aureola]